jgi:hypothetical protein
MITNVTLHRLFSEKYGIASDEFQKWVQKVILNL